MPRRRVPHNSIPSRPDSRRGRGNATDAQRPARRGRRRGQVERIAERRVRAFELRKAGRSYREIARTLACDVHTVHGDVVAELDAVRERTVEHAGELRELELQRCDAMTEGLWPGIRAGHPAAVVAGVRVGERRARLLGLDAATTSKTEVSGSLSIDARARYRVEAEELRWLDLRELEELAGQSQKMIDDAIARSQARRNRTLVAVTSSTDSDIDVDPMGSADQPPESSDR
jgi:hypothetical protein